MKTQLFTLKNGLTTLFIPTDQPSITVLLLVGAGSRYENRKNNGVAHFFEHMAFKGSKKYPNTKIISETIESTGGIFNAFTAKDHTGYWVKATVNHFTTIIDVLSDMILHPLLDPKEIEREKGVIVEEINMYEDNPQEKVGSLFEKVLYDNSPLGMEISGEKETVVNFSQKTFLDYIKDLYHPDNAVLVVAGGIRTSGFSLSDYLSIIEKRFSPWKNGKKNNFSQIDYQQKKPKIYVHQKKTEQAHFCLGYPTFGFFDKRKEALSVLATLLGGGMSSRLFLEVRERRGLCYYIFTQKQLYQEVGNLVTQAGIANKKDKIREAITVILKEQEKIKKGGVKKEELKKAKEMVKGRFLLSLEDTFKIAYFFGAKKLLEKRAILINEVIKNIDRVSANDVVGLAREIFVAKNITFTLIGRYKKEDFEDIF